MPVIPMPVPLERLRLAVPRHAAVVRITHWLTFIAFIALVVTGVEIVISHPRFYWGETGNVNTPPLFSLHIPSSRGTVPTGYGYVLPDQNGWSRALHFEAAWLLVLTGLVYGFWGLLKGHFVRKLVPRPGERNWRAHWRIIILTFRRAKYVDAKGRAYNALQGTIYLFVIFVAFPLMIWTGLAMSPSITAAMPQLAEWVGGRQSARTIHFFLTGFLLLFLAIHIAMIALAGFVNRVRAMITGSAIVPEERT